MAVVVEVEVEVCTQLLEPCTNTPLPVANPVCSNPRVDRSEHVFKPRRVRRRGTRAAARRQQAWGYEGRKEMDARYEGRRCGA